MKSAAQASATPHAAMRVLLVEDNPVNTRVALLLLKRLGLGADVAENGLIALDRVRMENYDLILMDLQMPEMGGIEATKRLRETMPFDRPPYICALTANTSVEDRTACRDAGMHAFMAKPLSVQSLEATLEACRRWLDEARAKAQA